MGSAISLPITSISGPGTLSIPIDAGAMKSRGTNSATQGSDGDYATNDVTPDFWLFSGATEQGVQFKTNLPQDYNGGTVNVKFFWDTATGGDSPAAEGVTWGLSLRGLVDSDAIDQAFSASVDTDDTVITTGDLHTTTVSSAITITNSPSAGDMIMGEITRVVGDVNDNMTEDAKLLGIVITYNALTASDAYRQMTVPAQSCESYTTNGATYTPTVYGSNEIATFAFDAATEQSVYIQGQLPDDYKDGSVVRWGVNWDAVATASGTAVFGLSGGAFGNDDALSTALGTERTVTDTLLAVGDRHKSPYDGTGITLAGSPVAGDFIVLKLVVKTSGTIAVDVLGLSLELQFERNGVQVTPFA